MIIPLFLKQRGLLSAPSFDISGYLEGRREEYVERMRDVSRSGSWTDWCEFFLKDLIEQAQQNQERATQIIALNARMQQEVAERTHLQFAGRTVEFIFTNPVFRASDFIKNAGISSDSARRLLNLLLEGGNPILKTVRTDSGRKPSILAFTALLNIADGENAA